MSLSSEFPLASNMLLLFQSDLQEQQSKLTHAVNRTHKEIRALADSGPSDVIDESCGNSFKEAIFETYSENRTQLRKVEAALERDNMCHEWTMKFIEQRMADRRILRLIQKWLKAGVSEDGQWSETKLGALVFVSLFWWCNTLSGAASIFSRIFTFWCQMAV
jgi:hypothetical protein